jgi:TonB family protein
MRCSIWLVFLLGCPPKTSSPPVPMPVDQAPSWTEEGPIAGPHNIVEGPPQEAIPSGTPGSGPWPPYLTQIRKAANERHLPCVQNEGVSAIEPALVVITVSKAGLITEVVLTRSSGSEPFDQCLVRALRELTVPPPPPELLEDDQLVSREIAFR